MRTWVWLLLGGLGLVALVILFRSKAGATSTVIVDPSTGSNAQSNLSSLIDGVAFGASSLVPALSSSFGSPSSSSPSPYVSTGGVSQGVFGPPSPVSSLSDSSGGDDFDF
jgi:hypothetical protein